MSEWQTTTGVECVSCPECAFTFDAGHVSTRPEGGYVCPLCEIVRLEVAVKASRELWMFDAKDRYAGLSAALAALDKAAKL